MADNFFTAVQKMTGKLYKIHREDFKYKEIITSIEESFDSNEKIAEWPTGLQPGGDMYATFSAKIFILPEYIIDGFKNQHLLTKNHIMMQLFRIPLGEPCTISSLLKIAVFTGVIAAFLKAEDFPEGIVRAFKGLHMHSHVQYIDTEVLNVALDKISKHRQSEYLQKMVNICRG